MLARIARGRGIWLFVLLMCVLGEAVALYYQYALRYDPCVLCVHVRAWILLLALISSIGLVGGSKVAWLTQLASLATSAGLAWTSYNVLAVEQGWGEGACTMNAGYPSWMPLDQWLPAVFKPLAPCSFTPMMPLNFSMAEGLMVESILCVLLFVMLTIGLFKKD